MADVKSTYLTQIEASIAKIQENKDVDKNLELIRKMINHEFKIDCDRIFLVQNKIGGYFFGLHVFPSRADLPKIADVIIKVDERVQFERCQGCVIELDSKLIYDLGATPEEITAGLLHEVGHRIYKKDDMIRTKFKFLSNLGKVAGTISFVARKLAPVKFLLYLAILNAFSNSADYWLNLKNEKNADSFAVKYGYGPQLYSLLDKISGAGTISIPFTTNSKNKDSSENDLMNWTVRNMMDFSFRKKDIKRQLENQIRDGGSLYTKEVLQAQIIEINAMKPMVSIDGLTSETTALNESVRSYIELMQRGKSELEIDEILIEIDRIETYEDKMYVLGRLYRNLAICDKAMHKLKTGKHDYFSKGLNVEKAREEDFKVYRKKITDMIETVRRTKIRDIDYGLFIKYPKGDYEE